MSKRWKCRRCGNEEGFQLIPHLPPGEPPIPKGRAMIDDRQPMEFSPTVYCGMCGAMVEPGGKRQRRRGLS